MESVKLTVNVDSAQFDKLESRINVLKGTPISLKIDAVGLDAATKNTTALVKACARLVEAQGRIEKSENSLEKQRLATEATSNRARQAEANLAKQQEKTATATAQLAVQQEKTVTAGKNLELQQEKTNTAIAKGEARAKSASVAFSDLVGTYLKFAAISAVRSGISDAFETMKDVDAQIVNIQKVTDASDAAMDALAERAYAKASEYGVAANEYLTAAADFAKAGYENYEGLAELATKTQLVGDVNAKTAAQFLLSADAAYKLGGNVDELSKVLDKANTIENNYATSIEKMAAGLPNVASTAAMSKVSLDELLAALGTVTAVTQESGEKASYALRSLFLNVLGEVGAEIDETTTVTAESVNSLWSVLEKYADASLLAAHNAGELIDPMKAIKALSDAQKEGLLEEADLMQIVMSLGGKLRTNQLNALISNYDMYEEMLAEISAAAGSADLEVATMQKSWEASLNRLQNSWTQFVSHIVSSDLLVDGLNLLNGLLKLLDNDFVSLAAKTALFLAVCKALANPITKLVSGFGNLLTSVKNLPSYIKMLGANEEQLAAVGLSAAGAQTALNLAIGGVIAVIGLAVMGIDALKRNAAELTQTLRADSQEAKENAEEHAAAALKIIELYGAYEQSEAAGTASAEAASKLSDALKGVGTSADLAKNSLKGYSEEAIRSSVEAGLVDAQVAKSKAAGALLNETSWKRVGETEVFTPSLESLGISGEIFGRFESRTKLGYVSLMDTDSIEDVLAYYDMLEQAIERVNELAVKSPDVWNNSAVEQLVAAYETLAPTVSAYREAEATEDSLSAIRYATDATITSLVDYKTALEKVNRSTEASDTYKKKFAETLQALYPEYAAQSEAAQQLAGSSETARESSKRFIDTLFDEKGALTDAASAMLETNGALQQVAVRQAKEDVDAAKESLDTVIAALGGENDASVVKALAILGSGVDAASADFEALGKDSGGVRKAMDLLKPAVDAVNAALERQNVISKATAETAKSGNTLIEKATAAYRGEAGAADELADAMETADTATLGFAGAQAQAQYAQAQLDFSNVVNQLGGVTSAAVQATIAMYAAYKAFSAGNVTGATSGAGFSKEQAALLSRYDDMMEAKGIADLLAGGYSGGGYSGGGKGGGGGASTDPTLQALKDRITLRKQELSFLQESGGSIEAQVAKYKEIQGLLHEQAEYMRSIGEDEADILKLSTEWWSIQNSIEQLLNGTQEDVNDAKQEQLDLEEKILAVQEAQAALANAQNERNIRVFNAKTGQWEWIANASDVSEARESVKSAQERLSDYDGDKSGYEDIISRLLTFDPSASMTGTTLGTQGIIRAAGAQNAMTNATAVNSVGQQMNGNIYQIAGLSFTEEQARSMTLYDLAQMSNSLAVYSRGI